MVFLVEAFLVAQIHQTYNEPRLISFKEWLELRLRYYEHFIDDRDCSICPHKTTHIRLIPKEIITRSQMYRYMEFHFGHLIPIAKQKTRGNYYLACFDECNKNKKCSSRENEKRIIALLDEEEQLINEEKDLLKEIEYKKQITDKTPLDKQPVIKIKEILL